MSFPDCNASVEQRWYAHATRPSLLVHEIHVDNKGSVAVTLDVSASLSVLTTTDNNLTRVADGSDDDNLVVLTGQNVVPEDWNNVTGGNHTLLAMVAASPCKPNATAAASCTTELKAASGASTSFVFSTSIVTSLNSSNPHADAVAAQAGARSAGTDGTLFTEHVAAWAARWARGSIAVEGDLRLAQAANASLYAIRASVRGDFPYGLSPGGLTSDGYNGERWGAYRAV